MPKPTLLIPVLVSVALGSAAIGGADSIHVAADTTVSEDDPNRAFGASASVIVQDTGVYRVHGYARFDLSTLGTVPPGTAINRATLRLWIGSPLADGYVAVHPVLGGWDESTLTWNTTPSLGSALRSVKVLRDDALRYVTIDVTPMVQDWLDGTVPNEGLALLPDSGGVELTFDSKESTATSHPMELEVVLEDANSGGDITAVSAPSGGGLQGGAASGVANLTLLTGCAAGQILKWTGSTWACAADAQAGPGAGWSLTGNGGTVPGNNFLGTTDNTPLELRIGGRRALRIEPNQHNPSSTPNIIGGYEGNSMVPGVTASVIAGGGWPGQPNVIVSGGAVISGGYDNFAGGLLSTVGGGGSNIAANTAGVVSGGLINTATGITATIGGGSFNLAPGGHSTVPGGIDNQAGGNLSFAAGSGARVRNASESGDPRGDFSTFVWADMPPAGNPGQVTRFTSTGPNQFLVRATGGMAINTNTPAAGSALTVNGNTTLTGNASTSGNLSFGAATRQMIDLYSAAYGIGVQSYSMYFRSDWQFSWFRGGVHNDGTGNAGGGTRQMRLDENGNLFIRGAVNGGGADFAEMLPAHDGVEPGDVLAIGADGRLTLSTEPYQHSLAGVYSTKPGLVGGAADGEDLTGKIPLAISGVIPVKVTDANGPIVPGDSLTSSSAPGRAMKASKVRVGGVAFYPSGVILGKALEPLASGEGTIQALVVLQ